MNIEFDNAAPPFIATHPGEMIKDELKERGMTQKQLADETGIKATVNVRYRSTWL